MTDDELERLLRAARPQTPADDGWSDSAESRHTLTRIMSSIAASNRRRRALRRARPFALGIGFSALVAAAVTVGVLNGDSPTASNEPPPGVIALPTTHAPHSGPAPAQRMALVAYTNCDAMLDGLRSHLASHIGPYGLGGGIRYGYGLAGGIAKDTTIGRVPAPSGAAGPAAPDHSTTNVQETGVGEPDLVETDGRRFVSVSNGMLRVVDAASHEITGTLDLGVYAGAASAQLLMDGDRLLVILGSQAPYFRGGPMLDYAYPYDPATRGTTILLVDLAKADPSVVGTLHTNGGYVDARMVDGTARLVVQSAPTLTFEQPTGRLTNKQRTAYFRNLDEQAPRSAWLPTYSVTSGGTTSARSVPCDSVSHPVQYSGESMLTVYSVDLTGDLTDTQPITLAADGTAVYGSTTSLYVASSNGVKTQLHRFGVDGPGRPTYLGSGSVPGFLLDSYSMSEYQGALRIVTTKNASETSSSALYELDADSLRVLGSVGGLGAGEQLHAVRFIGALAYVVTFQSVDPLYVLDLSDAAHPRRAGELTVTGYSDYLHPVADGRLLGVGQSVNSQQIVTGLQVSLFDVDSPAHPSRIARITRNHTPSETPIDPHAFLFWPATGTAVVPVNSWEPDQSGAAVVLHVDKDALHVQGSIRNPAVATVGSYDTGIERTLVIGDDLWTMSSSGLQASDLHTLAKQAWVPFQ
jgi:hypothetical protein